MKKNKVLSATAPQLSERYGEAKSQLMMEFAWKEWERLCTENAAEPKAVKTHTVEKIYPCIALYRAMQHAGVEKQEAANFLDWSCSEQARPQAESIRMLMKIPGMYKLMPRIFAWITVHTFGEQAGFQAKFYPTDSTRVKFDMTKCLYCDVCRKNGCPELVPCFCHTDDVTDGNMHPKLIWNRTKIMGDGADCCDFDLYIGDPAEKKKPR